MGGGDGGEYFDMDGTGFKAWRGRVKESIVVFTNDGDDGYTRLNGEVKRALFKRKQIRGGQAGPSALGENPKRELFAFHSLTNLLKSLDAILPILAIDKHCARERHKLAQKRCKLQFALGHDRGVIGKDATEVKNVDRSLMVAYEDSWTCSIKMMFAVDDEFDADERRGETPKGASDHLVDVEPLARDEREENRDHNAPHRADSHASNVDERVEVKSDALRAWREKRQ